MARIVQRTIGIMALAIAAILTASAAPAQDKYGLKVPNGLAFAEFKGYESWEVSRRCRTRSTKLISC
jgi:hypothetical protein